MRGDSSCKRYGARLLLLSCSRIYPWGRRSHAVGAEHSTSRIAVTSQSSKRLRCRIVGYADTRKRLPRREQVLKCIKLRHSRSEPSTLSQLKTCLLSGCGRAEFQLARFQERCRALLIADAYRRGARRSTTVPQHPLASNLFGDSYPFASGIYFYPAV